MVGDFLYVKIFKTLQLFGYLALGYPTDCKASYPLNHKIVDNIASGHLNWQSFI